jgi:hypothetical protein
MFSFMEERFKHKNTGTVIGTISLQVFDNAFMSSADGHTTDAGIWESD